MQIEITLTDADVAAIKHQATTHPDDPQKPEAFFRAFVARTLTAWQKERAAAHLATLSPEQIATLLGTAPR